MFATAPRPFSGTGGATGYSRSGDDIAAKSNKIYCTNIQYLRVGASEKSCLHENLQRLLDLFHHDIALRLHRARQLQQDVAEQLAVVRHLADARLDQIVEVARDEMTLQH